MTQFGRYEVLEELGRGAMGAVYKASDPVMDRVVAIKTILAAALAGPQATEYRERFYREARAAGRLSHSGLVTVYDVGVHEGTPYLVMEFVPGRTLESVLNSGERFMLERTYDLGVQLADALDYAHKNGVIHRDIKPANILLSGTPERARITDFGVAKLSAAQTTSTGALLGTPAFMAPEQFTGTGVDGRSDLFALGVILYWMATGDKPFTGDTITAVSYKIVHTEPIPPRKLNRAVPAAFETVILKCLEKDPAERYQTGQQLVDDLVRLRQGRTTSLQPAGVTAAGMATVSDMQATLPVAASAPLVAAAADTQETVALPNRATRSGITPALPPPSPLAPGRAATTAPTPPPPVAAAPVVAPVQQALPSPPSRPAAPPAAAPARPAASVPRARPMPRPQPPARSSRTWWIVGGALLVLLLLWGAGVAKKNREQAQLPAAITPGQSVSPPETPPQNPQAENLSGAPTGNKETKPAPPVTPEKPKTTPTREASRENPPPVKEPDISGYALQLEVYAVAPATVEVQPDDRPSTSRLLHVGHRMLAGADKVFLLRTDNAGALRLKLNGQELSELGPLGAPRTVRLTSRDLTASRDTGSSGGYGANTPAPPERPGKEKPPAPRAAPATLQIEMARLPKFLDLVVYMDNQVIFQQNGVAERGFVPLSEQRNVAPGTHSFRVFAGNTALRRGQERSASGNLGSGQSRTLRIDVQFLGPKRDPALMRLTVNLE